MKKGTSNSRKDNAIGKNLNTEMFSLNVCEHIPTSKNIKINALFNVLDFTLHNLPRIKVGSQSIGSL